MSAGVPVQDAPQHLDAAAWHARAWELAGAGARLAGLWAADQRDRGGGFEVHLVLRNGADLHWLVADLPAEAPAFPDLAALFPAAGRLQRAARDLLGVTPGPGADLRPWLRHDAWGPQDFPLRHDFAPAPQPPEAQPYAFVRVSGEGVHEIPVGPVHAGTIEPGHFRFSVVGERVLRLEERLGYKHKGIEQRFRGLDVAAAARLAGRVSGDSTVAYAWAFARAVEVASGTPVPPRAQWLRAFALERERVANHLGDLGYIGNDAGLALGLSHFLRLKEDWLRCSAALFGHRYLMDLVCPGGVAADLPPDCTRQLRAQCDALEAQVRRLRTIYDEHPGLHDRLAGTGRVEPALAARLGLAGLAGRASGQAFDLRVDAPLPPYDRLRVQRADAMDGDVAARTAVRFDEIAASLELMRDLLPGLPGGALRAEVPQAADGARGIGQVEGWRGPVLVAVEFGAGGRLRRVHPADPSWCSWPVLEHAIIGNIVPDFPLINKSFNLSYSGADL